MKTPGGEPWTEPEVRMLRDLHRSHSARQIGVLLGRSKASVQNKIMALGLRQTTVEANTPTLAEEIALAKAEAATSPLYRPGGRDV